MMPRIRVRIPLDLVEIMSSFVRWHEAYSEPAVILTQDHSRKGRGQQKNNRSRLYDIFPFQTIFSRNEVK